MKQISLKLKMYAHNVGVINNNAGALMLRGILFAFGGVALWYLLVLGNIVFNIVERKTAETASRALSSEVGGLELDYLALSSNIDMDLAHEMGFREVKAKFATRKSFGSLGINLTKNDI